MKEKLKTKLRRNMRIRTLSLLTVMSAVSLSAIAAAPTVSTEAKKAADMINADAPMQKMLAELTSPQGQKWRFNTQMEIVRIASPSRSEMRRQQELMRRFTEEWGFSPAQVMTRTDGIIKGAGLQKVDGLPVYNACVRIPGTYSQQSNLKDKISRYKSKIEYDEKQIVVLLDKALDSLKARGVRIDREQLESLIESAEGEDLAAILSVADCVGQVLKRLESQLAESNPTPELSKTYAGFYMMCNRLYLEAVNRALYQIGKVYMKRVAGIEKEAFKQINTAEEKLTSPNLSEAARATLKNNVKINHEILEVVKFYTRHLNKRTKELLEIREKAALNFEISLNTFMTMKIGADLADCVSNAEKDISKIFAFEPPALSALYDVGFKEQFRAVTRQIRNE
jgi:hypothetical protein